MASAKKLFEELSKSESFDEKLFSIKFDQLGSSLCTFGVGGSVDVVVYANSGAGLAWVIQFLVSKGIPYRILGNGSNVVFPDQGISDYVVIKLASEPDRVLVEEGQTEYVIPASASLMYYSRYFSALGYSGLEFAAGIPGTFGGAIKMNAGAHRDEIRNIVQAVKVVDALGREHSLSNSDLGFSYRHSNIDEALVVTEVSIKLQQIDPALCKEKRSSCLNYRKKTQPLTLPSAGSVFRNPSANVAAAQIIDRLGLKGLRKGDIMISPLHANWIVRVGEHGLASDIRQVVDEIVSVVRKDEGLDLQAEIIFW